MGLDRWSRRCLVLCVAFFMFIAILHTLSISYPPRSLSGPGHDYGMITATAFKEDHNVIQSLNLSTPEINYRRLCLTAKPNNNLKRQSLTGLDWSFLKDIQADRIFISPPVSEGDDEAVFPPCQQTHTVQVPLLESFSQVDTYSLMLGTATFLSRLNESLPEMARWLAGTKTKLLVVLRDENPAEQEIQAMMDKAEALGILLYLVADYTMTGEAASNFGLATHLYTHISHNTRWIGIIDDDTFFPSLPRLVKALSPYDSSLPWYIGGLTERHLGISTEGFKAWGGAGIFLSVPLLAQVAENHDKCLSMSKTWGDALWRDCIFKITSPTVLFTRLPGLNQLDMFDDLSGWYESGMATPLSLHHWKSWHHFPVPLAHLVTDITGIDALFQRYNSTDDVVFTNGYSIVQYPDGLPAMGLVEGTMTPYPGAEMPGAAHELFDSLGNLRPLLEEGKQKISWRFVTAVKVSTTCVRQFYVKSASAGQGDVDSVIEIDWYTGS